MENKMLLHLGCGKRYIPGFIHCDLSDYDHIDYKIDVSKLDPFASGSVDLIYACHVLEYFDRLHVKSVLAEWRRVLKVGGILRISVPNFESIVKIYLQNLDLDQPGILGPLYGKWQINNTSENLFHKTVYDFKSLEKLLVSSGFTLVKKYDWQNTFHSEYDDYSQAYIPHMDKKNGILLSLNIEAKKPDEV